LIESLPKQEVLLWGEVRLERPAHLNNSNLIFKICKKNTQIKYHQKIAQLVKWFGKRVAADDKGAATGSGSDQS
jgi:hypothetical protein